MSIVRHCRLPASRLRRPMPRTVGERGNLDDQTMENNPSSITSLGRRYPPQDPLEGLTYQALSLGLVRSCKKKLAGRGRLLSTARANCQQGKHRLSVAMFTESLWVSFTHRTRDDLQAFACLLFFVPRWPLRRGSKKVSRPGVPTRGFHASREVPAEPPWYLRLEESTHARGPSLFGSWWVETPGRSPPGSQGKPLACWNFRGRVVPGSFGGQGFVGFHAGSFRCKPLDA